MWGLQANPDHKGLVQKANWWMSTTGKKIGDSITAKDANLETTIDVQSFYKV